MNNSQTDDAYDADNWWEDELTLDGRNDFIKAWLVLLSKGKVS